MKTKQNKMETLSTKLTRLLLVFSLSLLLFACSKDDNGNSEEPPIDTQTPLIKAGETITSTISIDDKVIEEVVDSIVNYGNNETPALFYVNKSHKINGVLAVNGNDPHNGFRTFKSNDLINFIYKWAKACAINLDKNDTSEEAKKKKIIAFCSFAHFLKINEIDPAIFIALSNRHENDIQSLIKLSNSITEANTKSSSQINMANNVLLSLERNNIRANDLIAAASMNGYSIDAFVAACNVNGVNLVQMLEGQTKVSVSKVVSIIVKGLKVLTNTIIWFIDNFKPEVEINSTFFSILDENIGDNNPNVLAEFYYSSKPTVPEGARYHVQHGELAKLTYEVVVANCTLIQDENAGLYIARVGMRPTAIRCSGGMHVKGNTQITSATTRMSGNKVIASCECTVNVDYGDCCAFSRHSYLNFTYDAETGYKQNTWKKK